MHVYRAIPLLVDRFDQAGLWYTIGGGVAYDAMRGRITRPHKDIDLSVLEEDLPKIEALFTSEGFTFRYKRLSFYRAMKGSLNVDIFAWRRCGNFRQSVYDRFAASVPCELLDDPPIAFIGKLQISIDPPEVMHLYAPMVYNSTDQEFIQRLPIKSEYRFAIDRRSVAWDLDFRSIEAVVSEPEITSKNLQTQFKKK